MAEMLAAGGQAYTELKNLIVWVKDNGGMGTFYRPAMSWFSPKERLGSAHHLVRARPARPVPHERLAVSWGQHVEGQSHG